MMVVSVAAYAQGKVVQMGKTFLQPLQERDSVLIADQLFYGFDLEQVEEGTQFAFPQIKDTLMTNIRIVKQWQMDTLKASKAKKGQPRKLDLRGGLTITSFDEGIYQIKTDFSPPPLRQGILENVEDMQRRDTETLNALAKLLGFKAVKEHRLKSLFLPIGKGDNDVEPPGGAFTNLYKNL